MSVNDLEISYDGKSVPQINLMSISEGAHIRNHFTIETEEVEEPTVPVQETSMYRLQWLRVDCRMCI